VRKRIGGSFRTKEPVGYDSEAKFDVDENDSKGEDTECDGSCYAGEYRDGDREEKEEGKNYTVDRIEERHFLLDGRESISDPRVEEDRRMEGCTLLMNGFRW